MSFRNVKSVLRLFGAATACFVAPITALAADAARADLYDQAAAILESAPIPASAPMLAMALLGMAYLKRNRGA